MSVVAHRPAIEDTGFTPAPPVVTVPAIAPELEEGDERSAWRESQVRRERSSTILYAACVAMLVPIWHLADRYVESPLVGEFLWPRIVSTVVAIAAIVVVRSTTKLAAIRAAMMATILTTGVLVASFLPPVTNYSVYVIGFSTVFLGEAYILSCPIRYITLANAVILTAGVLFHIHIPNSRTPVELTGAGFAMFTMAFAATAAVGLRRNVEHRAFRATFQLAQRNNQLSRTLEALQSTRAQLVESEKRAALGRMLAGLSHEFNNPMNVIVNNISPLKSYIESFRGMLAAYRAIEPMVPQEAERLEELRRDFDLEFVEADSVDALAAMDVAGNRIQRIHAGLRAFIRGSRIPKTPTRINDDVEATVMMLERNAPEVVFASTYGDLPPVFCRRHQIEQVLFNLLQNAVDAVDGRGNVTITTTHENGVIEVRVSDDGPGVPAKLRTRIFEPFFTTKATGKGIGLGLAVCSQIVALHGGALTVEDTDAPGATFLMRLPIGTASTIEEGEEEAADES